MNCREVMALFAGAAAWPQVASAQQPGGMRRVGILMGWSESDPEYHLRVDAVIQGFLGLFERRRSSATLK